MLMREQERKRRWGKGDDEFGPPEFKGLDNVR